MNSYLKELADICGIQKNLSMHFARHTFDKSVTLSNGVPIENVSRMLGHTSLKTTQIYARIGDSKIFNSRIHAFPSSRPLKHRASFTYFTYLKQQFFSGNSNGFRNSKHFGVRFTTINHF